jgi:hypothetical protein
MKSINTRIVQFAVCLVVLAFSILPGHSQVQNNATATVADKASRDSAIILWLDHLNEEGVNVSGDSVTLSKEASLLLTDENYRRFMYPATYDWQTALGLIQRQDLKKAFWFFMNLYLVNDQNKDAVVKSFVTYNKIFKMDKILVNTFYTYVLADPEIGSFEDGQFKVTAPHIMEKKLNALKEILFYIDKYTPKEEAVNTKPSDK